MRHHTLNVADDRAFAFSTQLVDSYLQLFRTKRFNICADETFDLGKGQSKQEAQRVGVATLYATYVGKLCEHLSQQGHEPMFWGDIATEMPEILETLPNNVTLLNWQYDPEATDEKIQLVAKAGAKQIVCPAVWGGMRCSRASTMRGTTSRASHATALTAVRKACSSPIGAILGMSTIRAWPCLA
ncbi:MAG: family 20 glycosylhydrolase [Bifidobacterium sp.]